MHRKRRLQLCAMSLALALLPAAAGAQTAEASSDAAPAELSADAPLDLSTPELDLSTPELGADKLAPIHPSADKAPAAGWSSKVGVDYTKPAIPAVTFQPEQLLAGAVPDQSTGVAWATVTAPGMEAPLGWDKTSIETRIDPSQEQSKLGTTLSRSVPVGEDVALTWQKRHLSDASAAERERPSRPWLGQQPGAAIQLPADRHERVGRGRHLQR
jgi:hypothetical protein